MIKKSKFVLFIFSMIFAKSRVLSLLERKLAALKKKLFLFFESFLNHFCSLGSGYKAHNPDRDQLQRCKQKTRKKYMGTGS